MKKRILLSLVSFFMMTAMWASLIEAYQIYVTADAGKTYATAQLVLNLKNQKAINTWTCKLVLPEGVTFKSADLLTARIPAGAEPVLIPVANADGSVTFTCNCGDGYTFTGTDGAIAIVTVEIAGTVTPGTYNVEVNSTQMLEADGSSNHTGKVTEYTWTIEQGEEPQPEIPGDLNGDKKVDIADAVTILNIMAAEEFVKEADLNDDKKIDIADFVTVLNIMAAQ